MYENEAEYISQQKTVDGEGELVEDMARYEWMDQTTLDPSSLCEVVLDTSNPLLELEEPLKSIDPVPEGGPEEHILSDIDDVKFPILDGCQSECKDATKEVTADTKCLKPESLSKLNLNRVPKVVLCRLEDENHNSWTDQMTVKSAFNQVPQNNNRRVLKVLLHRLEEDEQIKKHWKKIFYPSNSGVVYFPLKHSSPRRKNQKKSRAKCVRIKYAFQPNRRKCKYCTKMFSNESSLKRHQASFHFYQCNICLVKFQSNERLDEHKMSRCDTLKVFGCDICSKKYTLKKHLLFHKTPICKSLRRFKCNVCQKSFQYQQHLKQHMNVHGMGQHSHSLCYVCGKFVKHFKRHLETHSDENKYFCKECGENFKTHSSLKRHFQRHLKRRFTCDVCQKTFIHLSSLRDHMSVHGMVIPTVVCDECGIAVRRNYIKRHMQSHTKANLYNSTKFEKQLGQTLQGYDQGAGKSPVAENKEDKPYVCSKCGKAFHSKTNLNRHDLLHSDRKPHVCEMCHKVFNAKRYLNRHMNRTHFVTSAIKKQVIAKKETKPPICTECGKVFSSTRSLRRHAAVHSSERPFNCVACQKSFKTSYQLKSHMFVHGVITTLSYSACSTCGKVCKSKKRFNDHVRIHTGEKPFSCNICGKSFRISRSLRNHMFVHGMMTTSSCLVCSTCGKVCKSKNDLNDHVRIHSGEKPFTCNICKKSFRTSRSLRNHMFVHGMMTTSSCLVCLTCSKVCKSKNDLNDHVRIHSGEKPFTCNICEKSFRTSSLRKRHMFVHGIVNNLSYSVCSTCGKIFKSKKDLNDHLRIHSGEKPFTCNMCGKSFRTSSSCKRHMFVHGIRSTLSCSVCSTCGKVCRSKNDLNDHVRIHTEEKPFNCNICGKIFRTLRFLKRHSRIHQTFQPLNMTIQKVRGFNVSPLYKDEKVVTTPPQDIMPVSSQWNENPSLFHIDGLILKEHEKNKLEKMQILQLSSQSQQTDTLFPFLSSEHMVFSDDKLKLMTMMEPFSGQVKTEESPIKTEIVVKMEAW